MRDDSNRLDFSQILKSKTQGCLERLEMNELIMDPLINLKAYKGILDKMFLLLRPMEKQIVALPDWRRHDFPIEPRLRSGHLQEDIKNLGGRSPVSESKFLLPKFTTLAQGLGALYVFEESTLRGGQILSHLSEKIGVTAEKGGRYFYSYGQQVQGRWEDFCVFLNDYALKNNHQQDDILNAACATYFTFERYIR